MVAFSVSGFASTEGEHNRALINNNEISKLTNDVYVDEFGCTWCIFKRKTVNKRTGEVVVTEETIKVCNNTCKQANKKYQAHLEKQLKKN